MIVGIGTDIINIARMKALFERHGQAFVNRVFTEMEREIAADRKNPIEYFAGRWAAKEAVSKALGCGIGANCAFQDINIVNDSRGGPSFELSGSAAKRAEAIGATKFHISISHEREYACAMVIMES